MLHPQDLSSSQIGAVLAQAYGVQVSHVVQRPAGADAGATVYQVTSDDGTRWWLKCRRYAVADAVWDGNADAPQKGWVVVVREGQSRSS